MLSWFRRRGQDRLRAVELYGAIVTQARQPVLFERLRVEDTPEGRTSLLILLMFPALERLQAGGERARRTARMLVETFITDIDDCLREMGVGDLSVPKKVKRAAQALGERCLAYRRAVTGAAPVEALAAEIATTVPGVAQAAPDAPALAAMIVERLAVLETIEPDALGPQHLAFALPQNALGT